LARGRTGAAADHAATAAPPPISLVARTTSLAELLPQLHQHALEMTGASCSLLFELNPRDGVLQATSGFGLEELRTDPWMPAEPEAALVSETFRRGVPLLVTDTVRQMPDLTARLGAAAALLLPLGSAGDRAGLLAIGFDQAPPAELPDVGEIADAFMITLELFRLRQNEELQRDLRELLNEFAASLGASLKLSAGLEIICLGARRLFGADRTEVWIHDRRARHLVLSASSDPGQVARDIRVNADDPVTPAAASMRRNRAELLPPLDDGPTRTVTIPLRGTRRALGTIVFEGVRVEAGGELALLDRADELGRQLSSAIENMQLLEEVQRSRRELENAFDSIAHLVVVYDMRGRIVHANEAFSSRLRLTRDQLIDRPLAECIGPELAAWLADHDQAEPRPAGESVRVRDIVDPVLNGPFMVTVTDLVNHERARVGSVIVARDLTPQSKLEAEREELRRRLTQSEKLAALGQFVAGIAHELNNPLQGVLGHLELMRATGAFPKQLRREVTTIYREADRAAKIVRNLLVFAGSRRLARRNVSLAAVLQKVIALRQTACHSLGIEVVRHYGDNLPRVQSDPLFLHQVFLNILMNAEHAVAETGRSGRIEVSATASSARDRVIVTVRDTGPGIPPDALPRIFEPFFTTKEVGKGTGLGLAIAYGIVQEHGGLIAAANHPEGGAVFTVELPAALAGGR
jgi:C4-dicarboxylate-specific signal transduction histidine kinase